MDTTAKRIIRIVTIIGTALLACFAIYRIYNFQTTFSQDYNRVVDQKAELESNISEQDRELSTLSSDVATLNSEVHSAYSVGKEVADIETNAQEDEDLLEDLVTYFDSSDVSLWMNDENESYLWEFLSDYAFDTDSINVIWVCTDIEDNIRAYATAKYSVSDEKFSNLSISKVEVPDETIEVVEEDTEEESEVIEDVTVENGEEETDVIVLQED